MCCLSKPNRETENRNLNNKNHQQKEPARFSFQPSSDGIRFRPAPGIRRRGDLLS